jgi:hypothetical protein
MTSSLIVSLLSERPTDELTRARDKMRAEVARLTVELEQVEEALARAARKGGKTPKRTAKAGTARAQVLDYFRRNDRPLSPAEVYGALRLEGFAGSKSAIYNAFGKLHADGEIAKVNDGQYVLASRLAIRNATASDGPAELSKNGEGRPLSTVSQPQEDP